ncbi:MAG: CinA family protein, partial [Chitinophagales bacterium]
IATAESCTGGYIAHRITSVPGSSDYFQGSVVSYSNAIKMNELGVAKETLDKEGAVSEATVAEMLKGICSKFKTELGIAVSGIAGPDGGTKEKPVGTVWIAVGKADAPRIRKVQLPGNRQQNIELTAIIALESLRRYLLRDV